MALIALGAILTLIIGLVDNFYFVPDVAFAFWSFLALAEAYWLDDGRKKAQETPKHPLAQSGIV